MRRLPLLAFALLTACTDGKGTDSGGSSGTPVDTDSDGTPDADDCAPTDPAIHPGAPETCNGVDDDCDGVADNDPVDGSTWYGDSDGDGHYGDTDTLQACDAPAGFGAEVTDCDDGNASVYPGADEACDLIDSNCDGELGIDEQDGDGDGFAACEDCDDADIERYPGAPESCNGIDDDCDGDTDEDASWYPDEDDDGYGDEAGSAVLADCDAPPPDRVDNAADCDDDDGGINPDALEVCDDFDVDEDCNGLSEDDDPDVTGGTDHYPDFDGDGYGDQKTTPEPWCDTPSDWVLDATDCDDSDSETYPGAPESDVGLLDDPACDGGGGSLALADFEFIGENEDDFASYQVSTAGDVDGDGLDDLFLGAAGNDDGGTDAGKAYLILGSTLAASTSSSIDLRNADFRFVGDEGEQAAGSLSTAGDVDGDGLDDLIIGARSETGKAYLILGSTLAASTSASITLSNADFELLGESSGDLAGQSVSTAGDVDGDGLDDLFIGASRNSDGADNAGKAYLILGSTLAASPSTVIDLGNADFQFIGEQRNDYAASSLSTAGDVDGDGLDDLFIGAYYNGDGGRAAGKAYLILGSTLAASPSTVIDLSNADVELIGEESYDYAAQSLGTAGDVDGDGLDDLIIGAKGNDTGGSVAGKAYIMLGSTLAASTSTSIDLSTADYELIGHQAYLQAGGSVSSAGDVDGDGRDDLLVGGVEIYYTFTHESDGISAGEAYLVLASTLAASTSSSIDLSTADFHFMGEAYEDLAGASVSTAGDVNGDGRDDLFIGAYRNDEGGENAGKAYLILSEL